MDIFTSRGIDPGIRDSRPYRRWEQGDVEAVYAADPLYRTLTGHELGDLRTTVNSGPGWVMTRHPIPGGEPIFAELRPDGPVPQGPTVHTHSAPEFVDEGAQWYLHTHSDDEKVQDEHEAARAVCYVNHRHTNEKKYTFPMGEGRAARLDVHPKALEMFERGRLKYAFYALEGVLKADAILSADEPAFSVPGVTLWYGAREEFTAFADRYLRGVTLFVITDSDWHNPNVVFNGLLCMDSLMDAGITAWATRPPIVNGDPKTGVDDYIGPRGRGNVFDLEVVELLLPEGFEETVLDVLPPMRADARENALRVLRWLVLHSTIYGDVVANSATIARQANMQRRTVNNSIDRLADASILRLTNPERRRPRPSWIKKGGWEVDPARYAIADSALRVNQRVRSVGGVLGMDPDALEWVRERAAS
jgi:hypothetical protein